MLAVDAPGWAFFNIAEQVKAHLELWAEPMIVELAIADQMVNVTCDLCVVFSWKSAQKVAADNRCHRIVVCVYDEVTWTATERMEYALKLAIKTSDAIGVANMQIADLLRHRSLDARPVFLVEDGVDRDLFKPQPMPQRFVVGWVGNSAAGHSWIKGLDLVRAACDATGDELRTADLANGPPIAHKDMPSWYAGISVLVCASTAEGTPNPPLEAMACGRPVITTRVGLMPRIISQGVNGMIVQRTAGDIATAITRVRQNAMAMGSAARDSVEPHAWGVKAQAWRSMIRAVLGIEL